MCSCEAEARFLQLRVKALIYTLPHECPSPCLTVYKIELKVHLHLVKLWLNVTHHGVIGVDLAMKWSFSTCYLMFYESTEALTEAECDGISCTHCSHGTVPCGLTEKPAASHSPYCYSVKGLRPPRPGVSCATSPFGSVLLPPVLISLQARIPTDATSSNQCQPDC